MHGNRLGDVCAVHLRAVLRIQVLHEQVLPHELEARMAPRDIACSYDDVGAGRSAHNDRTGDGDVNAAKLLGPFLDRKMSVLALLRCTFDLAYACLQDGEEEYVEKRDEQESSCQ